VLQELGDKILSSLSKLRNAKNIDDQFLKDYLAEIVQALRAADVSNTIVLNFFKAMRSKIKLDEVQPGTSPKGKIERETINELVNLVSPNVEPYEPKKGKTNVYMFVGLQGSGKTTTCAKLGLYFKRKNWKVALVGADTFRAGAREQLMQNAQRCKIPYYVDFDNQDPVSVAIAGVEKFKESKTEIIIVDTSGKNAQEGALFEEMQEMERAINPDEVIFVLDANIGQAAFEQASAFSKAVDIGSIIITKLDSGTKGGGAISAVAATGCPIAFYGSGEEMDMLEIFDPKSFISRILGYGDPAALIKKMEEVEMKPWMQSVAEGHFTFREMYGQYEMILGMGNFSSLLEMMGMKQFLPSSFKDQDITKNMKNILVVIDSMSDAEMDDPSILNKDPGRIKRIQRGTGMSLEFIKNVISEQKRWATLIRRIDKRTLSMLTQAQGGPQGAPQMNEKQLQQTMNKMMNQLPKGLRNKIPNMGNLSNLMKMMGGK
jgi:signal recognition particle subunit SRP54